MSNCISLSTSISRSLLYVCVIWLLHTSLLSTCVEARKSSGQRIIDTAKKAIQEASRHSRQRRDTSSSSVFSLESLLLPDPRGSHLVEYDLLLNEEQYQSLEAIGPYTRKHSKSLQSKREKRKAVRHSIYHWPGAVVPYEIHSTVDLVSSAARHRIQKAMTHWEQNSCIKFVPYNPLKHTNYVSIRKGQWCASKLGMTGGLQPLYIALGCLDTGTIIHELGHTIGWVHEQARPDRDRYVTIKWNLVSASYKSQYVKHGTDFVNTYGVPYDYDSIMHYPSYGELITNDPSAQYRIGQRTRLSFYDIKLANAMYKCADRSGCDSSKLECTNGGFIGHACECVCPNGDSKSCTVTNSILKPHPTVIYTTAPSTPTPECDKWKSYDNAYIPGSNDDIGFALSVEQCKQRCSTETMFKCVSFDYWKQRRQCYLSSSTASSLGIRFSHDYRMTHYELNDACFTQPEINSSGRLPPKPTSNNNVRLTLKPSISNRPSTTLSGGNGNVATTSVSGNTKVHQTCPFEYASTGLHCVRPLIYPSRPLHIAVTECQQRLGASIWEIQEDDEWRTSQLTDLIAEGEEYWVKVKDFQSQNVMAPFFDFCPYLTRENGAVVLKDTLCFKQKGFICQLSQ